jgi:hypothetical protein
MKRGELIDSQVVLEESLNDPAVREECGTCQAL